MNLDGKANHAVAAVILQAERERLYKVCFNDVSAWSEKVVLSSHVHHIDMDCIAFTYHNKRFAVV